MSAPVPRLAASNQGNTNTMILLFFILFYAISIELRVVLKTFDDFMHILRYNAFEELEFTGAG